MEAEAEDEPGVLETHMGIQKEVSMADDGLQSSSWLHEHMDQAEALDILKKAMAAGDAHNFVVRTRAKGGHYLTVLNHSTGNAWQGRLIQPDGPNTTFHVTDIAVPGATTLASLIAALGSEDNARHYGLPCALIEPGKLDTGVSV